MPNQLPRFVKSVFKLEDLPDDTRPQVALVGRSNVGKSSMINALVGVSGLARVSAEPGRTQTLNFFELEKSYYLVDLPGYGFARGRKGKEEIFTKLITDYLQETVALAMVYVLVDSRLGPTPLDDNMLAFLDKADIPHSIIATKVDKITHSEKVALQRLLEEKYGDIPLHFHTIKDSKGRGEIRRIIDVIVRKAAKDNKSKG